MARELCEVEGLIFKRKKYEEADVLAMIMTEDHGIFTIDVRGALRPKSRLGAASLDFSYGKYIVNTIGRKQNRNSIELNSNAPPCC